MLGDGGIAGGGGTTTGAVMGAPGKGLRMGVGRGAGIGLGVLDGEGAGVEDATVAVPFRQLPGFHHRS